MKPVRTISAALLLAAGAAVFAAAPAYAEDIALPSPTAAPEEAVCEDLDSGKINVDGSHTTLEITADPGYLITGYCVKAGSAEQEEGGPEYYKVDPPAESVIIKHSTGKDISHYSFTQELAPTTSDDAPGHRAARDHSARRDHAARRRR